jgi:hypothetical protein
MVINDMKKIVFLGVSFLLASLASCSSEITPIQVINDNSVQQSATKKYSNFKSDLFMAQSRARNWDMSAELVKAESRWVNENGMSNWTFYFKSPFKKTALKVDMGFPNEVPNMFFGREIRDFDIRVDVDKAIELAKKQGLKRFPISEMVLEKRSINAEWEIRSSDGYFRINAESISGK